MTIIKSPRSVKSRTTSAAINERTALLQRDDDFTVPKVRSPLAIVVILVMVIVISGAAEQLMDSPMTRVIESISCYRYYRSHDPTKLLTDPDGAGPGALRGVAEFWCKADAIQAEVATIRSYQWLLEGIPALALAVPFGWLQDRYGRRPFLIIGMTFFLFKIVWIFAVLWFWQTFDGLRLIWISSLHALMMGGSPVVTACYFTVLADVTTEKTRATIFLRVGACSLSTMFFIPLISAWLMTYNPWIPMLLGLVLMTISVVLTFLIPETLNYSRPLNDSQTSIVEAITEAVQPVTISLTKTVYHDLKEASKFLWEDYRVPILVVPFLLHMLIGSVSQLLVQYASKRYDFTVAKATVIVTVRSGFNVILLFSVLPFVSDLLISKLKWSGKYKDLFLTRSTLAIMGIGWILVGASPTSWLFVISLIITAFGTGAMLTLRSFLTSLVPADQVARTYSIVCLVDTLGIMFGSPILAECFELGMTWGDSGIGLPFYVLGAFCFVFTILLMLVRLGKS